MHNSFLSMNEQALNVDDMASHQTAHGMEKVLVVAEDFIRRSHLRRTLEGLGFDAGEASDGDAALTRLNMVDFEAIVLECPAFEAKNIEACSQLRTCHPRLPILILSTQNITHHRIAAFEAGVDDFMIHPLDDRELAARLRSALRRLRTSASESARRLTAGPIVLDTTQHRVEKAGVAITLVPVEFRLLAMLMQQPRRVISHSVLTTMIWKKENAANRKHLRVVVNNLRKKIEDDPSQPNLLITHPHIGYSIAS